MQTRQHDGRETRAVAFELRAAGEDGVIEGYGSVFGVRDSYEDVISPGAFAKSIAEHRANGTMPALLWQHDADKPIGVWEEVKEDSKGLMLRGRLAMDTARGKEAYSLLKMGALNGLSIGFVAKSWDYDTETDIRTLTAVELWEVSIVTFPANGKARITNIKSGIDTIKTPKDAERILRDAGLSKADALSIVSRVMRLGEERREAAESTARVVRAAEELARAMSQN
ncbi:MAG: HK97 family phage prohead protease [Candidatus Limnocylindrus sp.]